MSIPASAIQIFGAPFLFGAAGIILFGRLYRNRLHPGLLFHSIVQRQPFTLSAIPVTLFRAIMETLHRSAYCPVTVANAFGTAGSGVTESKKICITFDDGCSSFYSRALPVLESLQFKSTLFPVAGYLGKSSTWDVLPSFPHLTVSELREVSDLGHEIGSHTMTHANCPYLSAKDLAAELGDSRKLLEDITGRNVTSLSFPFGSWNRRVWDIARENGYTCATLYRGHGHAATNLVPVYGVYRFDTPGSVLTKLNPKFPLSTTVALAKMMSHFAKGAPIWKFRKNYTIV
jgi:peptidoglycan/xylan/chitin deacetylase (PgdA/CDA1 family)